MRTRRTGRGHPMIAGMTPTARVRYRRLDVIARARRTLPGDTHLLHANLEVHMGRPESAQKDALPGRPVPFGTPSASAPLAAGELEV